MPYPTSSGASDVWSLRDNYKAEAGDNWPAPPLPEIIQDGLELYLDASIPDSYSGSGTNWFDLTNNNNDGILTNGPSYSSNDGGQLIFDNVDDYVNLGLPTNIVGVQVPITINMWAKPDNTGQYNTLWSAYDSVFNHSLYSLLRIDSGTLQYFASTSSGSFQNQGSLLVAANQWHFFAVVVSGTISSPTVKIFLNGQSETFSYSAMSSTPNTSVGFKIAASRFGTEVFGGSISHASWYNRALSDAEIAYNYSSFQNRYGL